jgi:hypothetical protein
MTARLAIAENMLPSALGQGRLPSPGRLVRPVCRQLRKCPVRSGSYAWCQFRTINHFSSDQTFTAVLESPTARAADLGDIFVGRRADRDLAFRAALHRHVAPSDVELGDLARLFEIDAAFEPDVVRVTRFLPRPSTTASSTVGRKSSAIRHSPRIRPEIGSLSTRTPSRSKITSSGTMRSLAGRPSSSRKRKIPVFSRYDGNFFDCISGLSALVP